MDDNMFVFNNNFDDLKLIMNMINYLIPDICSGKRLLINGFKENWLIDVLESFSNRCEFDLKGNKLIVSCHKG